MAQPMDLSNCASLEQQGLFVLERLADLQRDEITNPDSIEILSTSTGNDLSGVYTFAGQFSYTTTEDTLTGVTSHQATPTFDLI